MKPDIRPITILVLLAALLCAGPVLVRAVPEQDPRLESAAGGELSVIFQSANASYEAGEYEEAVAGFERLAAAGVEESDLYYNLANAYFKQGDMGRSVLNYERALRLSPRDEDARSNLKLVRTMLKDKQFVENQLWIARAVTWLQRTLSLDESLLLLSLIYVVLALIAIGFIFYDTPFVTALHGRFHSLSPGRLLGLAPRHDFIFVLALASLLFLAAGGLSLYKVMEYGDRTRGVIVEEEVPVFSAPSADSVLQFRIHGGTKVRLRETRAPWVRISLPGGLSGWIPAGKAEII